MATKQSKSRTILFTIVFGAISLTCYYLVFTNEKLVTEIYTHGGIYTLFPVGTAFLFSFIHGTVASNLLSMLGLEPKKK